jgi:hypothetical protein
MRSTSLASHRQRIPAYGAVAIDETRIVGVRVTHHASGSSTLTITARGGVATFMTQSNGSVHALTDDQTFVVTTPLNVETPLVEAIEMMLLEWAATERRVRIDWERRETTNPLDAGPDYVRVWPVEEGASPLVIRRPAAVPPSVGARPRRTLTLA